MVDLSKKISPLVSTGILRGMSQCGNWGGSNLNCMDFQPWPNKSLQSFFFFPPSGLKSSQLTYNFGCGPFESRLAAWLTFDKPVWSWRHWSVVYLIWSQPAHAVHKKEDGFGFVLGETLPREHRDSWRERDRTLLTSIYFSHVVLGVGGNVATETWHAASRGVS